MGFLTTLHEYDLQLSTLTVRTFGKQLLEITSSSVWTNNNFVSQLFLVLIIGPMIGKVNFEVWMSRTEMQHDEDRQRGIEYCEWLIEMIRIQRYRFEGKKRKWDLVVHPSKQFEGNYDRLVEVTSVGAEKRKIELWFSVSEMKFWMIRDPKTMMPACSLRRVLTMQSST